MKGGSLLRPNAARPGKIEVLPRKFPNHSLVVMTLNSWKGDGAYKARLRLMAEEVGRLDPDILLLQECFAAPELGHDTTAALAGATGFNSVSWPGRRKTRLCEGAEAVSTSGLAVLSRHPIRQWRTVPLPSDPRDGERAALFAEIDHPAGTILAVSLHLTHLRDAQALRGRQFESVMMELAGVSPATFVIVGGDFNAAADAEEFVNANAPSGSRLVDCRRLAGAPAAATCPGNGDGACIDHILVRIREDMEDCKVLGVSTVLDRPDPETGLLASDHFGVKASIVLNPAL
ncbi:MAG TPA: endonuclease/exonuclease/phosphatase family protein [Acidocella sp.]|nr:endonuclease/exonuclease/phosphatase family protein [Acidocella sp.]